MRHPGGVTRNVSGPIVLVMAGGSTAHSRQATPEAAEPLTSD